MYQALCLCANRSQRWEAQPSTRCSCPATCPTLSEECHGRSLVMYEPWEMFVTGRVCLLGEHSDWAGAGLNSLSPEEVKAGMCIVFGTEQGLHARVQRLDDDQPAVRPVTLGGRLLSPYIVAADRSATVILLWHCKYWQSSGYSCLQTCCSWQVAEARIARVGSGCARAGAAHAVDGRAGLLQRCHT
jgi:hypothetical protein